MAGWVGLLKQKGFRSEGNTEVTGDVTKAAERVAGNEVESTASLVWTASRICVRGLRRQNKEADRLS